MISDKAVLDKQLSDKPSLNKHVLDKPIISNIIPDRLKHENPRWRVLQYYNLLDYFRESFTILGVTNINSSCLDDDSLVDLNSAPMPGKSPSRGTLVTSLFTRCW